MLGVDDDHNDLLYLDIDKRFVLTFKTCLRPAMFSLSIEFDSTNQEMQVCLRIIIQLELSYTLSSTAFSRLHLKNYILIEAINSPILFSMECV